MKTRHYFTAALIAAIGLTACGSDDENDNPREEVKIVTSVSGTSNAEQPRVAIDPATGAGNLENGDGIALQYWDEILNQGGGYAYTIGSTKIYWDQISLNGNPIDFIAWYPDYLVIGNVIQLYKVANAATEKAKDLLMAPVVTVNYGDPVHLEFQHVMHKLVVKLSSNVYTASELSNATIGLKNLKSDAVVDFQNGVVVVNMASGTDAYSFETGASVSFIVAPQNLPAAGTDIIEIQVGGKTYVYKIPTGLTALESGKVLTINLAINRDALGLASQNVTNWGSQSTINDYFEYN